MKVKSTVTEWIGKTVEFPSGVQCYMAGNDTLLSACDYLFQKDFKILIYTDSGGCSSCRLKLNEWEQLIEESDKLLDGKLGFLFYFQPKNLQDLSYIFRVNEFSYPVFIDLNNSINRKNSFPQALEYQCFLLDRENKVLAIGNPVFYPQVWELYKDVITGTVSGSQQETQNSVNHLR